MARVNTFTPDLTKIADAIGAARTKVQKGYSSHKVNGMSISQMCKEKRDCAILELHKKGMSSRKIAEALGVSQSSVARTTKEVSQMANSSNRLTHEDSTPAPLVVPQANTVPRPETQLDAAPWFDERLAELGDW